MISDEKLLIGTVVVLVLLALYASFFVSQPEEVPDTSYASELLEKAVNLGKNNTNYYYAYTESTSGYEVTYALLRKGDKKRLDITTPLSQKSIYWTENDSVLCTDFRSEEPVCSSIKNQSSTDRYILSLESKFFNNVIIENTLGDIAFMESKDYLMYSPDVAEKTVSGQRCSEIEYRFDFSNITVSDGIRLGVGATTPKQFDWRICVDNETGEVYEKYFNYSYNARDYWVTFLLVDSDWDTGREVVLPENLTEDEEAYFSFYAEKEAEGRLLNCFSEEGEQKESCIAAEALNSRSIEICELAGSRRDRCLVSFMPLYHDESICDSVISEFFKDDCYTELAGWNKDNSFCDNVKNESKKEYCLSISEINETEGSDILGEDIKEFMEEIFEGTLEDNETNETEANSS